MAASHDMKSFLRPDFADLEPYAPVKPLDVLAAEIGVAEEDLAKLDANENLHGPLPEILAAVERSQWHIYPDPSHTNLRTAISKYMGVPTDRLVCGCGSDELIDVLMRVTEPRAIINSVPTFGMYSFLGKICKTPVVTLSRTPFPDFAENVDAIEAEVRKGANLVILTSPNNPTGGIVPEKTVRRLCALDCIVVVDEAYAEFAGFGDGGAGCDGSVAHLAGTDELPNLVVFRTFSKWAALAGLRVGFSVAHPTLSSAMAGIKQPYNVNVVADVAAQAAMAAYPRVRELQLVPMLHERDAMIARLRASHSWLVPAPTRSNFVLFKVDTDGAEPGNASGTAAPCDASALVTALRCRGVLVRYYPKGPLAGFVRISAGRARDTARLFAALADIEAGTTALVPSAEQAAAVRAALEAKRAGAGTAACSSASPHAASPACAPARAAAAALPAPGAEWLLLDMDGVLVEVKESYRRAIIETAHAFGAASVSDADVDAIKARGGANNDWVVTHRLIDAALPADKVRPSLAAVTAAFEALYNGSAASGGDAGAAAAAEAPAAAPVAGLKALEAPLVSPGQMRGWRRAVRGVALVTGRPLRDAVAAMERFGWSFRLSAAQRATLGRAADEEAAGAAAGSPSKPALHGGSCLIDAVVCMEDGPPKPDPAPVNTALARLGSLFSCSPSAARAVMVGDTVDDARAAVAAGVRAVGVLTTDKFGPRAAAAAASLTAAGAFPVLPPRLSGLQALLAGEAAEERAAVASGLSAAVRAEAGRTPEERAAAVRATVLAAERPEARAAGAREGRVLRETGETKIEAWVRVDGTGWAAVWTGVGFLDHMLSALAKHSRMDLHVACAGDVWIDDHHSVEDCCIAVGEALDRALGVRAGIARWGMAHCPLDEALSRAVIDVSSRPHAEVALDLRRDAVGGLSAEMAEHALTSLITSARLTGHVDVLRGSNDHHKIESAFKAVAVAMRQAFSRDAFAGVPSTKGVLA